MVGITVMHDAWRLARAHDDEADLSLLSPASQRALSVGNGHALEPARRADDDLRDEIATLRKAVIALQRKRAPKAMTMSDGESLCAAIGTVLSHHLGEFAKRLDALEARRVPEFRGVWTEGMAYARATMISHQGSIWFSNTDANTTRPGTSDDWTLAVKRGRSATATRDAPMTGRNTR